MLNLRNFLFCRPNVALTRQGANIAVMARDAWTDNRLDDLNERVGRLEGRMDTGFAEMRQEFRAVRDEMAAQAEMLNRTMCRLFGGMLAAWVVGVIAIIAQV